jgi:sarcosine oxidase subunit gamma
MSALAMKLQARRDRLGLKGPRAAQWLDAHGIVVPAAPNTWAHSGDSSAGGALLVARLGAAEFFLEEGAGGSVLPRILPLLDGPEPGVYPVLREDWAFDLAGGRADEILAQVCNVNFAALALDSRPLVMTLMIGVAVLIVPQSAENAGTAERQYRIWCDPTFGPYLGESLGAVVNECGGRYTGVSE